MGLMDKVKAQATQGAQKAQEGVKAGQAKVEQAQGKKKGDALLRDPGAAGFAEKSGGGPPEPGGEMGPSPAERREQGAANGQPDTPAPADEVPGGSAATADPAGGDFKLDDL